MEDQLESSTGSLPPYLLHEADSVNNTPRVSAGDSGGAAPRRHARVNSTQVSSAQQQQQLQPQPEEGNAVVASGVPAVVVAKLSAKEQAAAEEAKSKLERMVKVEAMVGKRKRFFAYLKKTHEEGGFWLNCVRLQRQGDLATYAAELPPQRALRLFFLGIGLAKLLQSKDDVQLVRGMLQLLEEWEYHFALAGVAHQSVKAILAKNIDEPSRQPSRDVGEGGEKQQEQALTARLLKFNNEVVYEHLLTPHVSFKLDYFEVVFSLCDVMCLIYGKFIDEECYKSASVYDGVVKVDNKIKHHIINVIAKELTDMSANIAKTELRTLR